MCQRVRVSLSGSLCLCLRQCLGDCDFVCSLSVSVPASAVCVCLRLSGSVCVCRCLSVSVRVCPCLCVKCAAFTHSLNFDPYQLLHGLNNQQ